MQPHTVEIYRLADKKYSLKTVPARHLVTVDRFDLFAKLAYIKYRKSNPDLALRLYTDHIKAFNPDGKEPGREDKDGLMDFVKAFDRLIDYFEQHDFDEKISIVPVSEEGTILDGSHRIAALAYFNKAVSIAQFKDVKPFANFDYAYFFKRGMSPETADKIATEALDFAENLHVACLWPKLGKLEQRTFALDYLKQHFRLFYVKTMQMPLNGLTKFMYEIYKQQDWVGSIENNFKGARDKALHCYGANGMVQFVIFQTESPLAKVLEVKEVIRSHYHLDKHALHITDNQEETKDILHLILTSDSEKFTSSASRRKDKIRMQKALFKEYYLVNLKVAIAKFLRQIGLYKA